jgi:hypothetical protein
MTPRPTLRAIGLLAAAALALPAMAASRAELETALGGDGLQQVRVKGLDLVFARPGASLAAYQRVKVDALEVDFDKSWNPRRSGSSLRLSADEREALRREVARTVSEAFAQALQAGGRYPLTDQTGPDVLRVKPRIVDLYVNAPDAAAAGPNRSYTLSTGRMTLRAELFDGASGELLARVADRREGRDIGQLQLASPSRNAWEASQAAAHWARVLHEVLDKAHQGLARP